MTIVASTIIKTEFGDFRVCYHETKKGFCVSFSQGDLSKDNPIVRLHSACLFGEVFHSLHCDCYCQLTETMALIHEHKQGVIIYSYQEGMGIGLKKKIESMEIQRKEKCDIVEAFGKLGLKSDYRTFDVEMEALKDLGVSRRIETLSGSSVKIDAFKKVGYTISKLLKIDDRKLSNIAKEELKTKKEKMGYSY